MSTEITLRLKNHYEQSQSHVKRQVYKIQGNQAFFLGDFQGHGKGFAPPNSFAKSPGRECGGRTALEAERCTDHETLWGERFSSRLHKNDFAIPVWTWKVSKENRKKPPCCTYPPAICDRGLSSGSIERERNQAGCFSFGGKFRATSTIIGTPTFTWISRTKGQ